MAKKLKTKMEEIHKLSDADLAKELEAARRSLFSVRLQVNTQQLPNHRQIGKMRRQVARLKTVGRQRELAREGA